MVNTVQVLFIELFTDKILADCSMWVIPRVGEVVNIRTQDGLIIGEVHRVDYSINTLDGYVGLTIKLSDVKLER